MRGLWRAGLSWSKDFERVVVALHEAPWTAPHMRLVEKRCSGSIDKVSILEMNIADSGHQGVENFNYIMTPALRDALKIIRVPSS